MDSGSHPTPRTDGRLCEKCAMVCVQDEPDPCLGYLPGVDFACCGHGGNDPIESGYVAFSNGTTIRFPFCEVERRDAAFVFTDEERETLAQLRAIYGALERRFIVDDHAGYFTAYEPPTMVTNPEGVRGD